jgi:hypothetical protein
MRKTNFVGLSLLYGALMASSCSPVHAVVLNSLEQASNENSAREIDYITLYKSVLLNSIGRVNSDFCIDFSGRRKGLYRIDVSGKVRAGNGVYDLMDKLALIGVGRLKEKDAEIVMYVVGGKRGQLFEDSFISPAKWFVAISDDGGETSYMMASPGDGDAFCKGKKDFQLREEEIFMPRLLNFYQAGAGEMTCAEKNGPRAMSDVKIEQGQLQIGKRTFSLTDHIVREDIVINPISRSMLYEIRYLDTSQLIMELNHRGKLSRLGLVNGETVTFACKTRQLQ